MVKKEKTKKMRKEPRASLRIICLAGRYGFKRPFYCRQTVATARELDAGGNLRQRLIHIDDFFEESIFFPKNEPAVRG